MCREPWDDGKKKRAGNQEEGFTNLGRLQGQSPDRDASTYSSWSPHYGRKRQRW